MFLLKRHLTSKRWWRWLNQTNNLVHCVKVYNKLIVGYCIAKKQDLKHIPHSKRPSSASTFRRRQWRRHDYQSWEYPGQIASHRKIRQSGYTWMKSIKILGEHSQFLYTDSHHPSRIFKSWWQDCNEPNYLVLTSILPHIPTLVNYDPPSLLNFHVQ